MSDQLWENFRWVMGGIVAAIGGAVIWLIKLEKRLNAKVDTTSIMNEFAKIALLAEERKTYQHKMSHETKDSINAMNLKLEVMMALSAQQNSSAKILESIAHTLQVLADARSREVDHK